MEKDWIIIYTTDKLYQAELVKGMLKENNIDAVIVNRQDSELVPLGEVYVYVHLDNEQKARQLAHEAGME